MNDKLSYSVNGAAAATALSRSTIYELIKCGEIRPVKVGMRTLIMRDDLEAMLERRRAC